MCKISRRKFITTGTTLIYSLATDSLASVCASNATCSTNTRYNMYNSLYINQSSCDLCGLCVEVCPNTKIFIGEDGACFDNQTDDCACYYYGDGPVCIGVCPKIAITMS